MRNQKKLDYSKSIPNLYDKIKKIIVSKIKEKHSEYEYESLGDMKNKAILYLPIKFQSCAIALYKLVMRPKDEAFEYKMLKNIYKDLK